MKSYSYILYDWDGNIAQTLDIWLDACQVVLKKHGHTLSDQDVGRSFGQFIEFMKEWGIENVHEIESEATAIGRSQLPNVELYPGALEVLEMLHKKGKKQALVTTSPHQNVAHLLEKFGMNELFDAIVAGDDVEHHKPHAEPIEKALAALGADKDSSVMIGDSDKDLGSALNAGIDSILFYPKEHQKFYVLDELRQHEPTHIVSDFIKILEIV